MDRETGKTVLGQREKRQACYPEIKRNSLGAEQRWRQEGGR